MTYVSESLFSLLLGNLGHTAFFAFGCHFTRKTPNEKSGSWFSAKVLYKFYDWIFFVNYTLKMCKDIISNEILKNHQYLKKTVRVKKKEILTRFIFLMILLHSYNKAVKSIE